MRNRSAPRELERKSLDHPDQAFIANRVIPTLVDWAVSSHGRADHGRFLRHIKYGRRRGIVPGIGRMQHERQSNACIIAGRSINCPIVAVACCCSLAGGLHERNIVDGDIFCGRGDAIHRRANTRTGTLDHMDLDVF